jgi:hypothetical protein
MCARFCAREYRTDSEALLKGKTHLGHGRLVRRVDEDWRVIVDVRYAHDDGNVAVASRRYHGARYLVEDNFGCYDGYQHGETLRHIPETRCDSDCPYRDRAASAASASCHLARKSVQS